MQFWSFPGCRLERFAIDQNPSEFKKIFKSPPHLKKTRGQHSSVDPFRYIL
jgi:hypothetical protein